MIHVAVDANCLAWGWGGIPKVVDRIVRELVERDDVRVDLLANTSRPFATIPGAGQVYTRVPGAVAWREAFVARWVRRERPSVLWAPESVLPTRIGVPSVVTLHDLAPLFVPGVKPLRHRLRFRLAVHRSARAATRVVAVSQSTADDAERLFALPAGSVGVVPNGVDARFTPGSRQAAAAHVERRFGLAGPFVLALGSLEPRKGLPVLLEAGRLAAERGLGWEVVLAGSEGHRGRELAAQAAVTPGCRYLGPVPEEELVPLYRAAEALATPSLHEGFGLPPLEAMACATPAVVAAGSGGLVEVAAPAAVVVQEREPEAWVDALELARRDRERLAAAGLRHSARFRWPEVAERMLAVLVEAAASQPGRRRPDAPRAAAGAGSG